MGGASASTGNVRQGPAHGFGCGRCYLAGGIKTVSTMYTVALAV
jgi:hypothetical protein